MKFSQVRAFEKHLFEAYPDHLASIYLIIDSDDYAQRKWVHQIHYHHARPEFYKSMDLTKPKLNELFQSPSLFEPHRQIVLLEIDKAPKALWEIIIKALKSLPLQFQIILTASSYHTSFQKIMKEVIALDLSKEKPWDKEKRLVDYVQRSFQKANLKISSSLSLELVRQSAFGLAAIDQDVEKLICFLKGRRDVKREDFSLIQPKANASIFKVGEALLERRLDEALTLIHQEEFQAIPLIYALRSLFQRTLRLKEFSKLEALEAFPKFNEKWLDKMQKQAASYSKASIERVLIHLFDMEVMLKNQSVDDRLASSLCLLKIGKFS